MRLRGIGCQFKQMNAYFLVMNIHSCENAIECSLRNDGVNDLNVSANESIFSAFVCRMTHMNM